LGIREGRSPKGWQPKAAKKGIPDQGNPLELPSNVDSLTRNQGCVPSGERGGEYESLRMKIKFRQDVFHQPRGPADASEASFIEGGKRVTRGEATCVL